MLPVVTYDMIRQLNEERRARSLRRFWWRYRQPESENVLSEVAHDAELFELTFGAQCDAEEPIGA